MLETFVAMMLVLMAPNMAEGMGLLKNTVKGIKGYIVMILMIVVITMLTNMVRAWRYCKRDKKGKATSYGVLYGLYKGLVCAVVSLLGWKAVQYVPIFQAPFKAIQLLPWGLVGFESTVMLLHGFIFSIFYLVSYLGLAKTIWGVC